ncbi:unnamed protein product [Aureobasidium mustum]|uniref:Uncharacterized protein n=1 Tax=Aureobasidium mustum TaxID=2773714 RepID=A0A9N8JS45_9PEZI|nr:unnamed protein product [Aureobasidium mustum]
MSCNDDSLKLDADAGDVLLSPHAGYEWTVGGHQVGARWEEKELGKERHLGGPLPVHGNDSSLRLWFAINHDKNEQLVILTTSVKMRSKSKARPRSFFLVVPAEDLRISSAMNDFQPIPLDSVPEALFERPADPVSANTTRILHVSFALGHKRTCGVVMNTRPYTSELRGTPLALLDGLKSLSEARQFDLYLKFSSYAQVGLQRLFRSMQQNVAFFTPHVNLRNMYGSGWDGAFDLWEAQGWHNGQEVPSRKRKACSPLPEEEQIKAPPAYDHRSAPPVYADFQVPRTPNAKPTQPDPFPQSGACNSSCHVITPGSVVCNSIASGIPSTPYSPYKVVISDTTPEKPISAPTTHLPLPTLYPAIDPSSLPQLFDREMGMWLLTAWNLVPNIHFTLIHELLAVAAAVNKQDVSGYRAARMVCAKKLASCVADQTQQTESSNVDDETRPKKLRTQILASEPDSCISWLFMLRPEGDLGFMELLGKLEARKRVALSVSDNAGALRDVMVIRAAIILQALCMEGTRLCRV